MTSFIESFRGRIGIDGENIAVSFLIGKGYKLVARNFREKWGEIDIVVEKNTRVRFVEVKSCAVKDLSRENQYTPEELVDSRKLTKLTRTANSFMERMGDKREFQIDVVGVLIDYKKRKALCRHFEQVL